MENIATLITKAHANRCPGDSDSGPGVTMTSHLEMSSSRLLISSCCRSRCSRHGMGWSRLRRRLLSFRHSLLGHGSRSFTIFSKCLNNGNYSNSYNKKKNNNVSCVTGAIITTEAGGCIYNADAQLFGT